jgi:hypothetical protein
MNIVKWFDEYDRPVHEFANNIYHVYSYIAALTSIYFGN